MAGIYLHIPFCKQACYYCDFHFSTNQATKNEMSSAISQELHLRREYLGGDAVNTIYFGGGTPSVLSAEEIIKLLNVIREEFRVSDTTEVTLEANPDDLTSAKLDELFAAGVNRLSIGVQSFDDGILTFLHRPHSGAEAIQCIENARNSGFQNISIDLIYGIPGQSLEQWEHTMDQALKLQPEHLSAYSLTIEEKTVFGRWAAKGKLQPADEELAASHLVALVGKFTMHNFEHYEISNFARPGFISQHNSNYWRNEKYLGVGPSAHSFDRNTRQYNISNNALYLKSLSEGKIPFEIETLSREDQINDYILTGLRTKWGINIDQIKTEYHYDLMRTNATYVNDLVTRKLGIVNGTTLVLTEQGKMIADKIASDLFAVKSD